MVGETGKIPWSLRRELKQVICELELCSHVSAVSLDSSGRDSGEDVGGKRPPGGVDRAEDRVAEPERQKKDLNADRGLPRSAAHFRRRMAKARTERALEAILADAKRALVAWKRAPRIAAPVLGDPQWKRFIGESNEPTSALASRYGKTPQYINRVKAEYRDRQAA